VKTTKLNSIDGIPCLTGSRKSRQSLVADQSDFSRDARPESLLAILRRETPG
jgi:hypothetical protein